MGCAVKTRLIIKAGKPGTKRLVEKYGDALLCVRFRYDSSSHQRLKTVELVVEKTEWTPAPQRYAGDTLVPLRIGVADMSARSQAKAAGGRWDPEKRLWFVRYDKVAGSTLENYIYVISTVRLLRK